MVQEGKDGSKTTTTTYDVDPKTGELTNPKTTTETTPPVDRITEYGPVDGGTVYEPDPNLPVGETETTPGKPGDPNDPNNPPTDTVVHVGNKTTETTPIPHDTIDRYNPNLPVGSKDVVVQEGKDGSKTTTTTYDVDPKTGELTNPQTSVETTPPVDRITEHGPVDGGTVYVPDPNLPVGETETTPGKPGDPNDPNNPPTDTVVHVGNKVVKEDDVPYQTIYRDNPNLPVGTEKVVQTGITGKTQTITTYDVDPKTGELTNPKTTTVTVTEKQDKIIERGTGQPAPNNPDQPSNPETPSNPDQPSNPETPSNPDQPSNPETPSNPDQPSNPETPNNPEQPANPGTPVSPEQPANPGTAVTPEAPANNGEVPAQAQPKAKADKEKALPDTGNNESNGALFGALFAGVGALLLFGRRRKRDK